MTDKTLRCPYCVVGGKFHPMSSVTNDRLICQNCGHIIFPNDSAFRCPCSKCIQIKTSLKRRPSRRS